jgi:ATP-dependent Clp protease ATP-binding subunit ClpB
MANEKKKDNPAQILARLCKSLKPFAAEGTYDHLVDRPTIIEQLILTLQRNTFNNVLLVGDPGVGLTSIAYLLSRKIVRGNVPKVLRGKHVGALNLNSLVAGTAQRGSLEDKIGLLIQSAASVKNQLVLFIEDFDSVAELGKKGGGISASSVFANAFSEGKLQIIATCKTENLHRLEKEPSLFKHFCVVRVDEMDAKESIRAVRFLRPKLERHYNIQIADDAIAAAVTLSNRYLDEKLPGAACDLLEEACVTFKLDPGQKPRVLRIKEAELNLLKQERILLSDRPDDDLDENIAQLEKEVEVLSTQYHIERDLVKKLEEKHNAKAQVLIGIEKLRQNQQLDMALAHEKTSLPKLQDDIDMLIAELNDARSSNALVINCITSDQVGQIIEARTGVPSGTLDKDDAQQLLNLEELLGTRVIGQAQAIENVAQAIRVSRAGLQDQERPLGSFLFLGTSGVGKTELAKAVAALIFHDVNAMVRIDMSEYMESASTNKLIGPPPGYVGFGNGGQLTDPIKRNPFSVVLFDEIEKAHPDVFNLLLQVLDDGRLTDSKGVTVDFTNTIIIMTSNLGSAHILNEDDPNKAKQLVLQQLETTLRPEFINRIDCKVVFDRLTLDHIKKILDIHLRRLNKRIEDQMLQLHVTDAAHDALAEAGYDPRYGARPLARAIKVNLINPLANYLIRQEFPAGARIIFDYKDEFTFTF